EVYSQTGKRLSVTTLWRIIKRANFTRQKGRKWAVRRDDTLVNSFRESHLLGRDGQKRARSAAGVCPQPEGQTADHST
ncbi:unnamed protein product, partial [Phaeothamnion confervicola]